MRWLTVVFALGLGACRCTDPSIAARYADVVVVQVSPTGRELLLRDVSVRAEPVFMGERGEGRVPVRNVGIEEASIESITRLEGDPALTLEGEGLTIAADADEGLPFRFEAPQASDATTPETEHRARFSVKVAGGRAGDDELLIELVATAVARDCFVPSTLDFGAVPLRHAVSMDVVLRNGSPLATSTTVGAVEGADLAAFSTTPAAGELAVPAMDERRVAVRFEPLEPRVYSATVTMRRSAACPPGVITLTGRGDDTALAWTPSRLDFGRVPLLLTVSKTITFTSSSNAPLSLVTRLPGSDFVVGNASTALPPNGTATVEVKCSPTSLGLKSGVLEVDLGTEPVTTARIPLTCVGGGPRIRVDPNPLQIGSVPLNETTRRRIIVQNVGTSPATAGDTSINLVLGGPAGALPWFGVVPKNQNTSPSEFGVGLRSISYDPAVGVPAIAGKNVIEFELTITPVGNTNLREADLLIYSNDELEPVARIAITASPRLRESCQLQVSPPSFDFGRAPAGSTLSRSITVKNTASNGSVCLLSGVEMAPGSDLSFTLAQPTDGSVLISGGSQRALVVNAVVPPTTPVGTFLRGNVRFHASGEAGDRALPVSLLVGQCLIAEPAAVNVGLVQTGCTSASRPVTLYNVCGVPITIDLPAAPAPPFRLTSALATSTTIQPGDSFTLTVNAQPNTVGPFASRLTFVTTAGERLEVPLIGSADTMGLQTEGFQQVASETDILLVIDNSCSMGDEQAALGANFASFISAASTSGVDWHMGVVTTDKLEAGVLRRSAGQPAVLTPTTPNLASLFTSKVNVGVTGSGWETPFDSMAAAVNDTNRMGPNAGFIRPSAALAVVIVSDAADQSPNTPGSYVAALRQVKGGRRELVNISVVGPFSPLSPTCRTEGQDLTGRYRAVTLATGGIEADICTTNWAMDLESVSRTVFASRREFELEGAARGMADITVTVNGQPTTNWSFNAATNSVVFNTPVPPSGASIDVTYRTACF